MLALFVWFHLDISSDELFTSTAGGSRMKSRCWKTRYGRGVNSRKRRGWSWTPLVTYASRQSSRTEWGISATTAIFVAVHGAAGRSHFAQTR